MNFARIGLIVVACLFAGAARAQFGVPWQRVPAVTVVAAAADDPRLAMVDDAVAWWNRLLADIGSGFRLGEVTRLVAPVPEEALQSLGWSVGGWPVQTPAVLRALPGDLVVVLSDAEIVSFAGPFFEGARRVVGIRGLAHRPFGLPNVAPNVITHELGHAIGLGHNRDDTMLMCGRPAACRPIAFRADVPRIFPLTEAERRELAAMYPPGWK